MRSPVIEGEFHPRPNENPEAPIVITYFGPNGDEVPENSEFVYAKKAMDTGTYRTKYWILKEAKGASRGVLYDPWRWGLSVSPDSLRYQQVFKLYEMSSVSEVAFKHYLAFLKTGKELFMKYAERS